MYVTGVGTVAKKYEKRRDFILIMLLHMLFFTEAILLCAVRDAQCKTRESP